MDKTKLLIEGALFSAIAAIFQLIPVLFSEIFILFTVVSTIPIYLITRKNYKVGIASYVTTSVLILFFSNHEAIMFVFTNGFIGLTFGYYASFIKRKWITAVLSSIHLFLSLCVVNFLIGIPIFVIPLQSSILLVGIIFTFSLVYSFTYFYFIAYLIQKIKLLRDYIK